MSTEVRRAPSGGEPHRSLLVQARAVSLVSVVATLTMSAAAGMLGVATGSAALVAFAAVGLLDAVGSGTLVRHFHTALLVGRVSERSERAALRIIAAGMLAVAIWTAYESTRRLITMEASESTLAGPVLAGVSLVTLGSLARRKRRVGERLPSPALLADSRLSQIGALLAAMTLVGTAARWALGWEWVDPASAIAIAAVAVRTVISLAGEARRLPSSET